MDRNWIKISGQVVGGCFWGQKPEEENSLRERQGTGRTRGGGGGGGGQGVGRISQIISIV